jgi:ABC-type sugar transport system ATPase subunit
MRTLSIAQQQMVEIARALICQSKLIIMDEPTSSLTQRETKILLGIIRKLTDQGVSTIFISHKLEEVFEIADRITVLRDGNIIGVEKKEDCTKDMIVSMMVGREIDDIYPKAEARIGGEVLRVENICSKSLLSNISFKLHEGEILGFSGLVGSGRTELMRIIFGMDPKTSGKIFIRGKEVSIAHPADAVRNNIAFVTEDRKSLGLILGMSVRENISLSSLQKVSSAGFIRRKREAWLSGEYERKLKIKTPDSEQKVKNLSGGNQQKVVLSKWLTINPEILILDEPTRGIDVGAKKEIHGIISDLAQRGMAVILISSELPEVIGMSDRIIVMHGGQIRGEVTREEATQEKIINIAINK